MLVNLGVSGNCPESLLGHRIRSTFFGDSWKTSITVFDISEWFVVPPNGCSDYLPTRPIQYILYSTVHIVHSIVRYAAYRTYVRYNCNHAYSKVRTYFVVCAARCVLHILYNTTSHIVHTVQHGANHISTGRSIL